MEERPRERLFSLGPESLSISELLAIILRSGTRDLSALDLGQSLLNGLCGGSLMRLVGTSAEHLCACKGVGKSKAASLIAAIELGRRIYKEQVRQSVKLVSDSADAYKLLRPHLLGLTHEECWAVLLDNQARPYKVLKLTSGTESETCIDTQMVLKTVIGNSAKGFILAHNHPSGNPNPSNADRAMTNKLLDAALSCGVIFLDHIIVCQDRYYSFTDGKVITLK